MEATEALDEETRADAVDVLRDLTAWRLAPSRWQRVAESIDALHDALAARDAQAARRAVAELELAGPVRATRIGSAPVAPTPEPVRERANHLVHTLIGEQLDDDADRHRPESAGGDTSAG